MTMSRKDIFQVCVCNQCLSVLCTRHYLSLIYSLFVPRGFYTSIRTCMKSTNDCQDWPSQYIIYMLQILDKVFIFRRWHASSNNSYLIYIIVNVIVSYLVLSSCELCDISTDTPSLYSAVASNNMEPPTIHYFVSIRYFQARSMLIKIPYI